MPSIADYRFHLYKDTYVVWIAGINRYIQFKEPAFHVFQEWAEGEGAEKIAAGFAERYALPKARGVRFVIDIINRLQELFQNHHSTEETFIPVELKEFDPDFHSVRHYLIGNKHFTAAYGDEYLEELFHPLLRYYETDRPALPSPFFLDIFSRDKRTLLRVNKTLRMAYSEEDAEGYQGGFNMLLINFLHNRKMDDWMGVLHASAVTDGSGALLFTASSGSGKSSLATLMMVSGYKLLSDDFVPIALTPPEICQFSTAISVKSHAFPSMKNYVPLLAEYDQETEQRSEEFEVFIPPMGETNFDLKVPARAILFVHYDRAVEFTLKRELNLDRLNDILHQLWVANNPDAASRFLEWYFTLPVYTLRYSDNDKAVAELKKLFRSEYL